ncbi:methyl-accepting chemotaxis protein [uncultured Thermanaerothrix sp.]|uniref:methyl-accepting chemotaxis protein n=1 Tax=uncultured Thermanaerothrix sp. TaxID=1195149 RepID=UPI00260727CC|nr:methyl-accepting chemotaxis protein [uncultured Thermanaerothrix sp.]
MKTNLLNRLRLWTKLSLGFALIGMFSLVLSLIAYWSLERLHRQTDQLYEQNLTPALEVGRARTMLYQIRGSLFNIFLLPDDTLKLESDINQNIAGITAIVRRVRESNVQDAEAALVAFETAWQDYVRKLDDTLQQIHAGNRSAAMARATVGDLAMARQTADATMESLLTIVQRAADQARSQSQAIFEHIRWVLMGITSLALLISAVLAYLITRNLNQPIQVMVGALNNLSQGDLNRDIPTEVKESIARREDELGALGRALKAAEDYIVAMAEMADRIASGDLSFVITPRGPKDELGHAYVRMVEGLRRQVRLIVQAVEQLNAIAQDIRNAALQSGEASQQMARTLQQVAQGIAEQSESVNRTAASVSEVSHAIEGIARGAQEQSQAVANASSLTAQISGNVAQMAENVQIVFRDAMGAAQLAQQGVQAVQQTIEGIENIRNRFGFSAQRVEEMGVRSREIGTILETIQDIAAQTNLLALNAAIEAARAGEHGKGFAVVADEVRKLAERAAAATKEIGHLVRGIQQTVEEAVNAMRAGNDDVQRGVELANQAGQALAIIHEVSEAVRRQAELTANAAQRVRDAVDQLVNAVDSVSAVVEENTASTEEMTASVGEVNQAIETIASVSEENSAAIEEVSASAEEVSAQVAEVATAVEGLAEMARSLEALVAHFRLHQDEQRVEPAKPVMEQIVQTLEPVTSSS